MDANETTDEAAASAASTDTGTGAGDGKEGEAAAPEPPNARLNAKLDAILADEKITLVDDIENEDGADNTRRRPELVDDDDDDDEVEDVPAVRGDRSTATAGDENDKATDKGEDAPFELKLPGRTADDEDLVIAVDKPVLEQLAKAAKLKPQELIERVAQLRNGYGRRQQVEAERRALRNDMDSVKRIREDLKTSPIEFFTEHLDPKDQGAIVEALLARAPAEVYDAILLRIQEWDDEPVKRDRAGIEAEKASMLRVKDRTARETAERARTDFTNRVAEQITSLVPEAWTEDDAADFYDFAAHKLSQWGQRQPKGTRLDPAKVPELLEQLGALEPYGLTLPDPAAAAGKGKGGKKGAGGPPARKPAAGARTADAGRARESQTRDELQQRRDRRRAATTTVPGAGAAAAAATTFKKGESFDSRMKKLSKKLGLS